MYSLFIQNSELTRDPVFGLFFSLSVFIFWSVLSLHCCRGLFIAVHGLLKLWHTGASRAHGFSGCRTKASLVAAYRLSYPTTCGILVPSEVKGKLLSRVNSLQPHGLYSPWNSPGQSTGVGNLSLLQGIFPNQGLNPGLPHYRQILYQPSHKGPGILEWVAYPFSRISS